MIRDILRKDSHVTKYEELEEETWNNYSEEDWVDDYELELIKRIKKLQRRN